MNLLKLFAVFGVTLLIIFSGGLVGAHYDLNRPVCYLLGLMVSTLFLFPIFVIRVVFVSQPSYDE